MRRRLIIGSIVLLVLICALLLLPSTSSERKAVEKTRRELRQQGFKIDLGEFDFSTSAELRTRATALTNAIFGNRDYRRPVPVSQTFTSMRSIGSNSALVVWKEDEIDDDRDYVALRRYADETIWTMVRQKCEEDGALLDSACSAAMAGPIKFELNAKDGFSMKLTHLAVLRNLGQQLEMRALLELRDKNYGAAWTNLIALTRLVTAYEPEPVEVSHLLRYASVMTAYDATWQVLQCGCCSEEQLRNLQHEWESVNFFQGWPETAAFTRASAANLCQREREQPFLSGISLRELLRSPRYAWSTIVSYRQQLQYRHHGTYQDENDVMLYYRDRELQLQQAVKATTWSEMRQRTGVTNATPFSSKYPSRLQLLLNNRQMAMAFRGSGQGPLGRAAEAEARRRLIIAALALERFHAQNGSYPKSINELIPDFVRTVPTDFMDGKPLRYLVGDDGYYIIYSVGLDCTDNGGIMPQRPVRGWASYNELVDPGISGASQSSDIVWPRPADRAEVDAQKAEDKKQQDDRMKAIEIARAQTQIQEEADRRATVQRFLSFRRPQTPEPNFEGRPLSEVLQKNSSGSKLTLEELLTVRQIVTGQEPNIATFEVPIIYDVVTNIGELHLVVDGGSEGLVGSPGEMQELVRATNGDCLFVWNTIYDLPGQHALQARLECIEKKKNWRPVFAQGPVLPFNSTNICQFNPEYSQYDSRGVTLYAKLPESNGIYKIDLVSPTGEHVKTMSGSMSNGIINIHWDLIDEHGQKYTNSSLDSVFNVTLPDSGRSQSMKGP